MSRPLPTPPELVVLHTLRCLGATSVERLGATLAALDAGDVEGHLLTLGGEGLVVHERGPFGGWTITDLGRTVDEERIRRELDDAGASDEVRAAYDAFLPLNQRLLDLCGAWQLRASGGTTVLNDHADRAYDARVIEEFGVLDGLAQPVCDRLAGLFDRFSSYGPRLAGALVRVRRGDGAWLTDHVDSYHTVWFQLHEDLLVTLGIDRAPHRC